MNHDDEEHDDDVGARRCLAESNLARVTECACGVISLHIGALTIRLDESALVILRDTLDGALAAKASARRRPSGPGPTRPGDITH